MRGRIMQVAAVGVAALAGIAILATALQWWWLVTATGAVLVGSACLLALDADRQARRTVRAVGLLQERVTPPAAAASTRTPESEVAAPEQDGRDAIAVEELVGTIRVLQAQYVTRLDEAYRRLAALESAAAAPGGGGHDGDAPDRT